MPAAPPKPPIPPKPPPNIMPIRPAPSMPPIRPDMNGLRAKKPPGAAAGVAAGRACACWVGVASARPAWRPARSGSAPAPGRSCCRGCRCCCRRRRGRRPWRVSGGPSRQAPQANDLFSFSTTPVAGHCRRHAMCGLRPRGSRPLLPTLCEFGEVFSTGLHEKVWRWGGKGRVMARKTTKKGPGKLEPPSPRPARPRRRRRRSRPQARRQEEGRRAQAASQGSAEKRRPPLAAPPGEEPRRPSRACRAARPAPAQDAAAGRQHLRARPRQERRQLRAADAAAVHRAQRQRLSRPARAGARRAPPELGRDLCALPAAGLGAREGRHRRRRHGRDHGAQHSRDVRGAFRRADDRRAC